MTPALATKKPINKTRGLLTVAQAAAKLGVTRQNIHDAIERGRLKASQLGSIVVIERSSLESYDKSRKRTGRPRKN